MRVIDPQRLNLKDKILFSAMNAARPLLPAHLIDSWCCQLNYRWREHLLGPLITLLACIKKKQIEPGTSARDIEDWLASLADSFRSSRDGQVFCQARELFVSFNERMSTAPTIRLPELFDRMLQLIADAVIVQQDRPPQPHAILQHRTCYPTLHVSRSQWLKDYYVA